MLLFQAFLIDRGFRCVNIKNELNVSKMEKVNLYRLGPKPGFETIENDE